MTDIDAILPPGPKKSHRPLARRPGPARNTESLRASLDRVVGKLGFPAEEGVTAASLELGIMLKRARLAKGLTQEELARRVGLAQAALSLIENGRGPDGPTWATISRLCTALGIEPVFLPAGTGDGVPSVPEPAREDAKGQGRKVSGGALAKAREVGLDEAAVTIALTLLSAGARRWIRKALERADFSQAEPSRSLTNRRSFYSLPPHGVETIEADAPLVVIAVDGSRVDVRSIAAGNKAKKTIIHEGVALVGNRGAVEIGNVSDERSLVFAVPAARLLRDDETSS